MLSQFQETNMNINIFKIIHNEKYIEKNHY